MVVLWRLRYKLRLRDLAEMFLERGFVFSHEAVRDWEARFAPLLAAHLRARRRGTAGSNWHADETYSKVNGRWRYLYRAIDRAGNLVDALLSERRDMDAAQQFFHHALAVAGKAPDRVTTDGHDAYPRDPRDVRCRSRPSHEPVQEQAHRAGPPRREATLLPDARVRQLRLCRAFRLGL
jgi:putative transposase